MRIRRDTVTDNPSGRVSGQVQHHYAAAIYYITIEHGFIVVRDFFKKEIGKETDKVTITPLEISADFEFSFQPDPGKLIVTVGGFAADTNNSDTETFEFLVTI